MIFPKNLILGDPSDTLQFLLAAGVALAAAAPIGPISILTLQRAMALGFWRSFGPALGAVIADGLFGFIAALGSGYLTTSIMGSKFWLRLLGSVILAAMGVRLFTRQGMGGPLQKEVFGQLQLGLLNLTLVLSNPLTLGFYLAAFAVLGLESEHLFAWQSFILTGGILFGSLTWFTLICAAASRFHLKVGDVMLDRIRRGVGVLFLLLGLVSAVRVFTGN
jgi:threonine/homoserine/homoserine lactone efflux protein